MTDKLVMPKLKRPEWCPHKNCKPLMKSQELICTGKLPKPEAHSNDHNTHRFCLDERETGHGIHDLMINHTDAWTISLHMNKIMAEKHDR